MTGDCELAERLASDLKQAQIWHEGGELVDRLVSRIQELEGELYHPDPTPERHDEFQREKAQRAADIEADWKKTVAIAIELQDERNAAMKKYMELIMAVGNRYEGENRHETALRYIRSAENQNHGPVSCAPPPKESDGSKEGK